MPLNSMPGRRRFLQLSGAATGWLAVGGRGFAQDAAPAPQPKPSAAARRFPFDLSLASYTLHAFPLDRVLPMTVRVGLKHICLKADHLPLTSTPQQIAETVAKIKAAGLHLYGGGVIYMTSEADVEAAFQYAKAAGMGTIVGVPVHRLLPLVNDKVQQFDIRVAIHNHGPGDKNYPTPQSAYERIQGFDRRVGLCIDIGHVARAGLEPARVAKQYADRLLEVHIKDVTAATPKGQAIEIGRGVIDIPKFLRVLTEVGYTGFLSFEYEKDSKDPLPGLAESVGYVRGALAAMA
jgi:sugar phosphate isomerase/epimerase